MSLSSNPSVWPHTPLQTHNAKHHHDSWSLKQKHVLTFSLQGRQQQQRGANPGGGQQERLAASALHAPPGGVRPGEEDLEVRLRGVLGQVQLARGPALQGAAGHRCGTGHAPEPHLHPSAGGFTEEPLHRHVTPEDSLHPTVSLEAWSGAALEKWTFIITAGKLPCGLLLN